MLMPNKEVIELWEGRSNDIKENYRRFYLKMNIGVFHGMHGYVYFFPSLKSCVGLLRILVKIS